MPANPIGDGTAASAFVSRSSQSDRLRKMNRRGGTTLLGDSATAAGKSGIAEFSSRKSETFRGTMSAQPESQPS